MKTLFYVKIQIKNLLSDIKVSILYFIGLPLIIGFAMNYFNDSMHNSASEMEPINIKIEDKDNSIKSNELINYLNSKELESVLNTKSEEFDLTVEIPKSYGEDLVNFKNNTVKIIDNDTLPQNHQIVKNILDSYHFNMYKLLKNEKLENNIEVVKLESKQMENSYSFYAVSLITFVFGMIVLSLTRLNTEKEQKAKDERVKTTPISEIEAVSLKYVTYFIYSAINIGAYCLVYRLTKTAFMGNIIYLIIAIIVSSLAITSIIIFLSNVLGEKFARAGAMVIFTLPLIGGGVFLPEKNIFATLSPVSYITNVFESFERTGSLSSAGVEILGALIMAVLLYGITIMKVRRGKISNETTLSNMG